MDLGKVIPLIAFGITVFLGGLYWHLWDDSRTYIDQFVVNNEYYTLMYWLWKMLPAVMIIIGLICLISAGVSASRGTVIE